MDGKFHMPDYLKRSPTKCTISLSNRYNLSPVKEVKAGEPGEDEFDYCVTFETPEIGFELVAAHNGYNALVGRRQSEFARQNVFAQSLLCSVNDQWVLGKKFDRVKRKIIQAFDYPPITLRFRTKRWMADDLASGNLLIQVVSANELAYPATHASVCVDDALLLTSHENRETNISWSDVLSWKDFRPDIAQHATLKVWNKHSFLPSFCIGRCEIPLPKSFEKMERYVLELKDSKNRLVGAMVVRCIMSQNYVSDNLFVNQEGKSFSKRKRFKKRQRRSTLH